MTRDFNPAVERMWWSTADGQVYFTADDADKLNLFTLNPKSGAIKRVDLKMDYVQSVDMASHATSIAWFGQTGTQSRLLYVASKPGAKAQPAGEVDFGKTLENVAVGEVSDFSFQTQRGDTITGYSILPYGYDPNKSSRWWFIIMADVLQRRVCWNSSIPCRCWPDRDTACWC